MNYKNLNYEIETDLNSYRLRGVPHDFRAMNYKNLNYEIETISRGKPSIGVVYAIDNYEL